MDHCRALGASTKLLMLCADDTLASKEHVGMPDPMRKGGLATEQDEACRELLCEFYPALACSLVDDMIREGEGECEPLEEAFSAAVAVSGE